MEGAGWREPGPTGGLCVTGLHLARGGPKHSREKGKREAGEGLEDSLEVAQTQEQRLARARTCSPARSGDCGPEDPWTDRGMQVVAHFRASRGDNRGEGREAATGNWARSRSPSRKAHGSPRGRSGRKGPK